MAKKNKEDKKVEEISEAGATLLSWEAEEFSQVERSWVWYLVGAIIALGLVVLAVLFRQWLLAIIVVLLALVLFQIVRAKPGKIEVKLTENGILAKGKFYPYQNFKSFGIVEGQNRIEIDATKAFGRSLTLPFYETDEAKIVSLLEEHLENVAKKETWVDKFSHALRI